MSCQSPVISILLNPKPTHFYHTCRNTYKSGIASIAFELYLSTVKCNFAMEIKCNNYNSLPGQCLLLSGLKSSPMT